MNLPNKLTVLRVLLIPVFIFFLMLEGGENRIYRMLALGIFIFAAFTDTLDGIIARKYHLITNFGKFMDPLADKLLVCSALVCFIELRMISSIIVLIVIAREFIISGFRLVASDSGIVIAAGIWGKLKTVAQMICVILLLLDMEVFKILTQIFIWAMLALTIISLIEYIISNHRVLTEGSM